MRLPGVLAAVLLASGSSSSAAGEGRAGSTDPEVRRLRPGSFLYAAPRLREPNFAQTVVLLIDYGPKGAMGLVIDRPTATKASDVLKDARALAGIPVYWGGPVQPDAVFGLVRGRTASRGSIPVFPDVFLTGKRKDLEAAVKEDRGAERVRIYVGYAGWAAGQLESEVLRNGWLVAPGQPSAVFSAQPEKLWRKAYELLERLEARDPRGGRGVARLGSWEPRP